jgi:hypothetical protein
LSFTLLVAGTKSSASDFLLEIKNTQKKIRLVKITQIINHAISAKNCQENPLALKYLVLDSTVSFFVSEENYEKIHRGY